MHVLVVLVELGSVGLGGESGQSFFEDVDSQGLVARNNYIDPEVKLVAIDEEWVGDVARDDAELVDVEVVDVVDDVDASATTRVAGLHDPDVTSWVCLLEPLVVTQ